MPHETEWWACPVCELPSPMAQHYCGACGQARTGDVGSVTVRTLWCFIRDAFIFKPERRRR